MAAREKLPLEGIGDGGEARLGAQRGANARASALRARKPPRHPRAALAPPRRPRTRQRATQRDAAEHALFVRMPFWREAPQGPAFRDPASSDPGADGVDEM